MTNPMLADPQLFSQILYERMQTISAGIADMELFEFRYALENTVPKQGWESLTIDSMETIERLVNDSLFYQSIHLKPQINNRAVLDDQILHLTRMLMVGLVSGAYPAEWIIQHFYFDVRGFYFLHRTQYSTPRILAHLGEKPYRQFEPKQKQFDRVQAIGYKAFAAANQEVDECFIELVQQLVKEKGKPTLIALAGQTAAGKTEIVARLRSTFEASGNQVASIEMDHFLTDRDYREAHGIDSLGKEALHYAIFQQCLKDICQGKKILTPRYDFVLATSSHTLQGDLKPGCQPVEIDPADIIFIEGNFPFLLPEIAALIDIKIVYLTADDIRMKRKWRRDMDYRKKYELMYFLNRYFREQFLMAQSAYLPQLENCDLFVDTTGAAIWVTPQFQKF